MQRRILLTGSNGLLGQKIILLLAGRPHLRLVATSKGPNRHPLQDGYEYAPLDLTDPTDWETVFRDLQPTDVIHTAAQTQVDICETDKAGCDAINVHTVQMLADLCRTYQSRLVHISTDFIFDGAAGPYREQDLPNPVNYYGMSKLRAEQIIQAAGIPHVILRTILLYGVVPAMSRSNIVLWVRESLEAGKTIQVVDDQFRTPTLAEDLAVATVAAVMRQATGVYHISGSEFMSILELARRVATFWKLDTNLIQPAESAAIRQPAKRPPRTGFIILKAQTELDFRPHSLEQGLALVDRQLREMQKW
ncbi:MAG: SDR family oxidoreductase [Bacteroidia bacterium]|nr:SDR family oxidoreductase [Bacteroidia bacterium]